MSEQQGWRKVSEWGQPDAETCPWGLRDKGGTLWNVTELEGCGGLMPHIEWQPLPPPVDEVLPPPEPDVPEKIADYVQTHRDFGGMTPWQAAAEAVRVIVGDEAALRDVIAATRPDWMDTLNAVDRGETVGRVRPWQEAPDDATAVLYWDGDGWGWTTGRYVRRYGLSWMAQPAPPEEVEG